MKFLLAIVIICISGCTSFKQRKDALYIAREDYTQMNGAYTNCAIEEDSCLISSSKTVWGMLGGYEENDTIYEKSHTQQIITIRMLNAKRMELSLTQNDTILKQKILKGHFVRGYFKVRTKTRFFMELPFVPVWGLKWTSYRFGKTNNNQLYLTALAEGIAVIVILPFMAGSMHENVYQTF